MRGVLGIDPGITGGLAIFNPEATPASGLRWVIADIPVVGDPSEINAPAFRDWLRLYSPSHCFVEFVTPMPSIPDKVTGKRRGMGATSAFRFGGTYYSIKAIVAVCDIPQSRAVPQSWKKYHGLKGPDKELSRQRALQLFPDQAEALARKKDHARAEAMLIAVYGAKQLGLL